MGLLFNRGCSGHHFSEWSDMDRYRITAINLGLANDVEDGIVWTGIDSLSNEVALEKRQRSVCGHSGCFEERYRWRQIGRVPFDEVRELIEE